MAEITIIGAGLVGTSLALALSTLSQGQLSINVIEAAGGPGFVPVGLDARVLALAAGTCQQLARLGVWQAVADGATAITAVHVSEQGKIGSVVLRAEDHQLPALGQMVELHTLNQHLAHQLTRTTGITCYAPARVVEVRWQAHQVVLLLDDGREITTKLLVAATGSHSALLDQLSMPYQTQDQGELAVLANITTAEHHQGYAFERFTPQGPLALLPISAGRSALVWCLAPHHQDMLQWDEHRFLVAVQGAFGWRLGKLLKMGARQTYPLISRLAPRPIRHRLVLVGNAAQSLHPIAAQGFNLGMRDVIILAEIVTAAWQRGEDIGDYTTLSNYLQRRQHDKQRTLVFTDRLRRVFSHHQWPWVIARHLGLMALQCCPSLRSALTAPLLGYLSAPEQGEQW